MKVKRWIARGRATKLFGSRPRCRKSSPGSQTRQGESREDFVRKTRIRIQFEGKLACGVAMPMRAMRVLNRGSERKLANLG